MRGWTLQADGSHRPLIGYPAHAGMDLTSHYFENKV